MSLMTMLAPPSLAAKLDLSKCMKMCLLHDMAESIVGDITPMDKVPKPEKHRRELLTMEYITGNLLGGVFGGSSKVGEEILAIWNEHEDSKSLESHFVQDLDKVELLLQMVEYEKRGKGTIDLGQFAYVTTRIILPEMRTWAEDVLKEREKFWGGQQYVHGEDGEKGGVSSEMQAMQDQYYTRD
jgi:putative hydrolases of HD superfamily